MFVPGRRSPVSRPPVQSMTLQELRDELDRTNPAWEAMDLDGVHASGQFPSLAEDGHRHQMVADELLRSPCRHDALNIQRLFSDDTQGNTRQSRSKPDAANMMQIHQNLEGSPS
jgi:hypothetical protein